MSRGMKRKQKLHINDDGDDDDGDGEERPGGMVYLRRTEVSEVVHNEEGACLGEWW